MASTSPLNPVSVDLLVDEFERTQDICRLEVVADLLGATHDPRAVGPLLGRLGSRLVQRNEDVEEAVCSALVVLGVMERSRFGRYLLLPKLELDPGVVDLITTLGSSIPMRYFLRAEPPWAGKEHPAPEERVVIRLHGPRWTTLWSPMAYADERPEICRHGRKADCPYCREHV